MKRVILTTGGTGGHIFPALAVAEALRERYPAVSLLYVGSLYGPEKELAAQAGLEFIGLPVRGFLGRGVRALGAAALMARAVGQALGIMRRFRPDVVAGFGGYAAFAPVLAASLCGIPAALHEQNAVAGMSNRLLGRCVSRVLLSLEGTRGFAAKKCVLTGNPIRQAVVEAGQAAPHPGTRRLLVMGGSQGARALNDFMLSALPRFREAGVEILHQTGVRDLERVRAAYSAAGWEALCVQPFITDMAGAYAWADVALCRAGASTVAELAAAGLPAVLIPFPYATHDHQTWNARLLEQKGAALLIAEKDMATVDVAGSVLRLLENSGERQRMAEAARAQARPDAAARVVAALAQLCGEEGAATWKK